MFVKASAALKTKVSSVILISSDKAVRPTNIMGASKRFAEMIVQSFDKNSDKTKFCMVRFAVAQKLCFISKSRPEGKLVWIHACSVGEVRSSYNIIKSFIKMVTKFL